MKKLKPLITIVIVLWVFNISMASEPLESIVDSDPKQNDVEIKHTHEREWLPLGGIKYDSVQKFTVYGSFLLTKHHPERKICNHDFWIIQIEAGEGCGKIQGGTGFMYMTGASAKLSLMHTWNDPVGVDPNQTYLGVEGQINLFLLNTNMGLYTHIHGDSNDNNQLITFGIGFGF